jgi:NADPH2:quinone reductase
MHAAVLHAFGQPVPGTFAEPEPRPDAVVVEVLAAGLNHLDLMKASGTFYTGPPALPSVVGSDGVGRDPAGRVVYFDQAIAPFGSMAERTLVPAASTIEVDVDVDPVILAALGNAALAAHTALQWRAQLEPGETVVVLGATGVVGRLVIQVARLLGAQRVIAAGRDPEGLVRATELGADDVVRLDDVDGLADALAGGDVIVDLLWGPAATAALTHAAHRVRLIQLGQLAAVHTPLAAPLVRSHAVDIRGHAVFHVPYDARAAAYRWIAQNAAEGRLVIDTEQIRIHDIEAAWRRQAAGTHGIKQVVVPD